MKVIGTKYYRHSILLTGTKEEMEAASLEHKQILEEHRQILEEHRQAKELHNSKLNAWLKKHQKQ
jgi:Iap family predicted aminopeptidase